MNSIIETLNQWGGSFSSFAWPMLWQSSLLILILIAFEFLFRRQVRASVRYALWLILLVKLCVPPTLALPTSPAWWLHKPPPPAVVLKTAHYTVTYDNAPLPEIPQINLPVFVPPKPAMTGAAWMLTVSVSTSLALFVWLLLRWWQITRQTHHGKTSERLAALTAESQKAAGVKISVAVKLTSNSMSPAVCGLFRPAILIPQSLAENFSDEQLRAVLLHELIHLRRRDVWVNFLQALLQIFYWWHPLVWLANARIRRVREEAVDDAVMLALCDQAETYAPTLLEVAKLALNRPLASLGLVGILESRHALRQRIERLVDFRPPRRAGLTLVSLLGILAFTAVAVPMGQNPTETGNPTLPDVSNNLNLTNPVISAPTAVFGSSNSPEEKTNTNSKLDELAAVAGTEAVAATNLITRTFKAETRAFIASLKRMGTDLDEKTNSPAVVSAAVWKFFGNLGVNWESPAGKACFFNDRNGMLFVRATASDLNLVEQAVQALNYLEPQIHIKAQYLVGPKDTIANLLEASTNANAEHFTGTLNATKAQTMLQTLKTSKGFEMQDELEATTTSERQVQMRKTDIITVITNFEFQAGGTNGFGAIVPATGPFETGAFLDVVPHVLPDGYTINLSVVSTLNEFWGYATPPKIPDLIGTNILFQLPVILPQFGKQQTAANVNLWDGQTAVIVGTTHVNQIKSIVPVIGSVPLLGRLFRSTTHTTNETLVFITVSLVDVAGHRIHSEDQMPFAKTGVPMQPSPPPK